MSYNRFPKGSEGRKWDLHVHTPASYLSQYPEDWPLYVNELVKAIKKHGITTIATADYFTIEGYSELLKYYDRNTNTLSSASESTQVYIIPGLELRLDIFNSSNESINFHVVFDPDNCGVDFIKENFLEKLRIRYRGAEYDLRERNLVAIGYSITQNLELNLTRDYSTITTDEKSKYLKAAYRTIALSQADIKLASKAISDIFELQNIKRKPCLKIIAGKGHGSLKSLKWFDQQNQFSRIGLTREDLTNTTDLVFSNDQDDIDFYLGKHPKTGPTEVRQRFGDLKACVWGSDCHSIGTLLHPSNGNSLQYTWIKADPTFEGLKQVVYEPHDRVKIQEDQPDVKTPYLVIDKVRFKLNVQLKIFSDNFIEINPNMNVIIGGKSSGKSLLLFHIAKTVDPTQVEDKMKIVGEKGYGFETKYPDFDFEVHWKDGHVDLLKGPTEKKQRQITYIPQMYINHLAEEKGEQKLKELIEDILSQNEGFKSFLDLERTKIQNLNIGISSKINELFALKEKYRSVSTEIKSIGDKGAIQTNIERIKKETDELRKKAGFTPTENQQYEKLVSKKEFQIGQVTKYQLYLDTLIEYLNFVSDLDRATLGSLSDKRDGMEHVFSEDHIALRILRANSKLDTDQTAKNFDSLKNRYSQIVKQFQSKVERHTLAVGDIDSSLKPFLTKIVNQGLLKKLNEDLDREILKLKQIDEKLKEQLDIGSKGKITKQGLIDQYKALFDHYNGIVQRLSQIELSKIGQDLELTTDLAFNINSFADGFCNLLDGRSNFQAVFGDYFNERNQYKYSEMDHLQNIQDIFEKVWTHEKNGIKFKAGVEAKDSCYKLYEDYFAFRYTIKQNNDDILSMSPGKRGLVLLQLILHLSNANHPILIDQPEDNLDNRTIFNELNQFVKDKKMERQILIVTHNANLVVSTDSEQVIVANQQGQDQGKENREYNFEYVTGALEFSFKDPSQKGILYTMGIREHVCDILEGGENAFKRRELKYGFR